MQKKKQKVEYHNPPLRFDIALGKYVPDLELIGKFKEKLKKKK